jgi:hypothetical protein
VSRKTSSRSRKLRSCSRCRSARSTRGTGGVLDRRTTKPAESSAIGRATRGSGSQITSSHAPFAAASAARLIGGASSSRSRPNRYSRRRPRRFLNRCWQLDVPSTMLGFVRHLWWRHAVRDRRLQRRSAGTSSEAREERQERPGMHIEAQQRDDPLAQSESRLGDRSTNDQ